ncbi:MAG: polyribonucleotide nucleotidyltransferase [bacterium]|nr:polyribonucleotide nucleotidyltransferase [bacterium]
MAVQKWKHTFAGKELSVERGRMASQANGSVTLTYGGTTVLATAVMSRHPRQGGGDFFPLMVEFEEKLYAAGKIKGSRFVKREGKATDEAVLTGRLIDRTVRPLFNQRMRNEVQIVITVLSIDGENDPDVLGILGASLALATSDIPWSGPLGAVRVGISDGSFVFNPSYPQRKKTTLDAVVAGTKDRINMIEAGACEIPEKKLVEALETCQQELKDIIAFQEKIVAEINPKKAAVEIPEFAEDLVEFTRDYTKGKLREAIFQHDKSIMAEKLHTLKEAYILEVGTKWPEDSSKKGQADFLFEEEISRIVHEEVLKNEKRPDGRRMDEVRDVSCEVGVLLRTHGSSLFNRGNTQALGVLTLGAPGDEQIIENIEEAQEFKKHFIFHYNFPPFSVGEVKPMRGPSRRDIGHGALAERAVASLLPPRETFPYTIRVVSEILSSNGSSSMASVSAASLALMDGGVPITKPAAGIAMGLMTGENGAYKVLTDIQGPEDHHGDMDFKVAGTDEGITALQMDVKIEGVTIQMLEKAFAQAREARLHILEGMKKVIDKPREDLSPYAPRIVTIHINPEKIRDVIGPGGKVINKIIAETGVQIDIEDDGSVFVTAVDQQASKKAIDWILQLTREVKVGELFEQGKVTRLMDFGAFVEVLPNQEGLVHISEMAPWRVEHVEDVVKVGDIIPVYVKEIDDLGRVNLSLKIARTMLGQEHPKAPEGSTNSSSSRGSGFYAPHEERGGPHRRPPGGHPGGRGR